MMSEPTTKTTFDTYANAYDEALDKGISVSGENKAYFARGRVAWLARCLERLRIWPDVVLDYGCGTGTAVPFFFDILKAGEVVGVDLSVGSLEQARRSNPEKKASFFPLDQYQPKGHVDLAFCNGVFHHIPLEDRAGAVAYVYQSLRPGGLFAFWENNPWNPGTRLVMKRIPFDRDALPVALPQAKRLLRAGGFELVRIDFLFIFPKVLSWFRKLEPAMSHLPFGAQYQVLCRKPASC